MRRLTKPAVFSLILLLAVGLSLLIFVRSWRQPRELATGTPAANKPAYLKPPQAEAFDSLQEAISAAHYKFYTDEKASQSFYANNPRQNLLSLIHI